MLITATSSPSGLVNFNPVVSTLPKRQPASDSSATASGSSSSAVSTTSSSTATSSSSSVKASASSGHAHAGGGGSGAATASAASEVETLVGSYSATVAGTQYAGSVEEENGTYTASVPNVSGATATGATMMEAESNLTIRIDELV